MRVSLLTAGKDQHYALGILGSLIDRGIQVDFVANDEMSREPVARHSLVRYLNLRGDQDATAHYLVKAKRLIRYYWQLVRYAIHAESDIFHILWFNRFEWLDNTILILLYKALGKKIAYTAHNVSTAIRDGRSSIYSEWSLRFLYSHVEHIFVHTNQIKAELMRRFDLPSKKVTVVPFPVNNIIPRSALSKSAARNKLELSQTDRILLFFGNIAPYKGLEDAVLAIAELTKVWGDSVRLLIVGRIKECPEYWNEIERIICQGGLTRQIITRTEFVPDPEVGCYFRASDVLVLPYKRIYQSGVLFLGYNHGLPAIVTNVGALKESVVEGVTGFVCESGSPADLAKSIQTYFQSSLFHDLENSRNAIIDYVNREHGWARLGETTCEVYNRLAGAS